MNDKLNAIRRARESLSGSIRRCNICPRHCGADRTRNASGYCRAGANASVYSFQAHFGEEPPISGTRGSGTIFFSRCNMRCVYCQNYSFSQCDKGAEVTVDRLAEIMLRLQTMGCHNINLVSPSHFVTQVVSALEIAVTKGLDIPIVYNTSGYDLVDTLKLLDGVIDIYLPDMRYADNDMAKRYSDAPDYSDYNRPAVAEMHKQVGCLDMDADGIARKGLIIRLLALPGRISGTEESLKFIKENVSPDSYLSIMSQYYPAYKSYDYPELSKAVTASEYKNIVDEACALGLNNGWIQETPPGGDSRFFGTNIKPGNDIK